MYLNISIFTTATDGVGGIGVRNDRILLVKIFNIVLLQEVKYKMLPHINFNKVSQSIFYIAILFIKVCGDIFMSC